jgi:putative NADH-flavin reductase
MDPVLLAAVTAIVRLGAELLEKGDSVTAEDVADAKSKTNAMLSDYDARLATIKAARAEREDESGE